VKTLAWLAILACLIAIPIALWDVLRRHAERRRASESRGAALVAEAMRSLASRASAGAHEQTQAKGQNSG
jgi:hypothetical protein